MSRARINLQRRRLLKSVIQKEKEKEADAKAQEDGFATPREDGLSKAEQAKLDKYEKDYATEEDEEMKDVLSKKIDELTRKKYGPTPLEAAADQTRLCKGVEAMMRSQENEKKTLVSRGAAKNFYCFFEDFLDFLQFLVVRPDFSAIFDG